MSERLQELYGGQIISTGERLREPIARNTRNDLSMRGRKRKSSGEYLRDTLRPPVLPAFQVEKGER